MKIITLLFLLSTHTSMAMEDQEKMNDEERKRAYSQASPDEHTNGHYTDVSSYDREREKLALLQREAKSIVTSLEEGAKAGCPKANYSLGKFYEKGKWVKKDAEKAARFFEIAAKSDHPGALYRLGNFEIDKIAPRPLIGGVIQVGGVDQRTIQECYAKAARYYQQAVSKGHLKAHLALGKLYRAGQGVNRDLKEAERLFDQVAQQGHIEATKLLVSLYCFNGKLQNYEKCVQLHQFLVSEGDSDSMERLAWHYDRGWGVPQSFRNASEYDQHGFLHGDRECGYHLGNRYDEGEGVPQDFAKVFQYKHADLSELNTSLSKYV